MVDDILFHHINEIIGSETSPANILGRVYTRMSEGNVILMYSSAMCGPCKATINLLEGNDEVRAVLEKYDAEIFVVHLSELLETKQFIHDVRASRIRDQFNINLRSAPAYSGFDTNMKRLAPTCIGGSNVPLFVGMVEDWYNPIKQLAIVKDIRRKKAQQTGYQKAAELLMGTQGVKRVPADIDIGDMLA